MKRLALLCLSTCLAGCVSSAPAERAAASKPAAVVYAYQGAEGMCYMRYLRHAPLDQICVNGENVRYSASSEGPKYLPMPRHAEALFDSISVERVLRHRYSAKSRNPADRPVD